MTCLVPGRRTARTMVPGDGLSLKEILRYFLDFRLETVRRRFEYELEQLRRRIHILEGFRDHLQRPGRGDQDHPRVAAASRTPPRS